MDNVRRNDRAGWLLGPPQACTELPIPSANPWRLILLGAPGVGKGTQAALLNQQLLACHLSTGDVFRAAKNRNECDLTAAMRSALEYMRRGDLVPDSTVLDMVRERAACLRCGGGFILDGFPRTLEQAQALAELLAVQRIPLTAVINYELPSDQIVARLGGRKLRGGRGWTRLGRPRAETACRGKCRRCQQFWGDVPWRGKRLCTFRR